MDSNYGLIQSQNVKYIKYYFKMGELMVLIRSILHVKYIIYHDKIS